MVLLLSVLLIVTGCAPKKVYYVSPQQRQAMLLARQQAKRAFEHRADTLYRSWRGVPYRPGGEDRRGIDCSAFMQKVAAELFGVQLPRTVDEQVDIGRGVSRNELEPGDLVFFRTGWFARHVGLYLGSDRFLHASTSKGVTISALVVDGHRSWWGSHFWCGRRIH